MTAAGTSGEARNQFRKASADRSPGSRKKPVAKPFSIRLSEDERSQLLSEAGRLSLSAHIRFKLFGETVSSRRGGKPSRNVRQPSPDRIALSKVLATLGRAEFSKSLADIAEAAQMGALPVTPELVEELHAACADVRKIRAALIEALGVKAGQ